MNFLSGSYCRKLSSPRFFSRALLVLDSTANLNNQPWPSNFNVGDIHALVEPVVTQQLTIVRALERYLDALRLNADAGAEIWKFEMSAAISVGPVCAEGSAYTGHQDGEGVFYCPDSEDGSLT